jgi:hypothetical protein
MKASSLSLLIISAFFGLSCVSPLPVSQLEPADEYESFWVDGSEVLTQTKDSLSIELSYLRREGQLFVFNMTVANLSSSPLLVDPSTFYYLPIVHTGDTLKMVRAVNPENVILDREKTISKLDASRKNKMTQGAIFGSVEVASMIASVGKDESDQGDDYSIIDQTQADIAEIDYQTMQAIEQRNYWENESLRKTTLFPDHYVQGRIYMRWTRHADTVWLFIPVNQTMFEFIYDHRRISVYGN